MGPRGRGVGLAIAVAVATTAGCGGGNSNSDAGSGTAGAGGAAGAGSGAGGLAGGAAGATGAAGTSGGLPACAVATRPSDPIGTGPICNTIAFGGDWVVPEIVAATDGGVALDGGAIVEPSGGTIRDGDYDLVRFATTVAGSPLRRTIRLFEGGTFFEWLIASGPLDADGGSATESRFNTSQQPTHPARFMLTITCANTGLTADASYGYTAVGDDLVLFARLPGDLAFVHTYRRTCAR